MMNTTVVGKLYGGTVYEWVDKKNDNEDRSVFRGRIGYRNPENGDFEFMDTVCFKDFGKNGGLVGFLDKHFTVEDREDKTGFPVILTGYVKSTEKKMEVELRTKKAGVTKTVPNVPYKTYEFVIQTASFAPTNEARNTGRGVETDDEDFEDIDEDDEFEVVTDGDDDVEENDIENDDAEFEEAEEVEEKPARQRKQQGTTTQKKKAQSTGRKQQQQAKKEVASSKQKEKEDETFFDA